jgi:signal transduction histidine kinase
MLVENSANGQIRELLAPDARYQELDDARMQFTLLVAHELRAPVAAIHSYIKLMLEGTVPEKRQREILARCADRSKALLDLIADLMAFGQIQQGMLVRDIKAVQVEDVLEDACDTVRSWANERQVTIRTDRDSGLAPVVAEPNHIEQLWMNLISNAIKYTEAGGTMVATVCEQDGHIAGAVKDTGIGIAEKDQGRVFQAFFRTDEAKAMERDGSGLGLWIAKHIVERYDGEIELESEKGVGTTVTFKLSARTGDGNEGQRRCEGARARQAI